MNILYETKWLRLQNDFEHTELVHKWKGRTLCEDDFYGDPSCGLISPNNDWAIMAGEHLTVWKKNKNEKLTIHTDLIQWVHEIRLINDYSVNILTDPWSNESAIWNLDVKTMEVQKIRNFLDYQEKEYSDNVEW